MGIFDKIKDFGAVASAPFTGGASLLLGGEDTLARIPVVGGLMGAETDAQKALLKKQEEMAAEAKRQQERNQQMRLQALGQSLLAFNPRNQMMAQMFGPQAAFSPQQMAGMAADPGAPTPEAFARARQESLRTGKPMQGIDADAMRRMEEDQRRRRMVEQQTAPLGPGPAPLRLPPPQTARRF